MSSARTVLFKRALIIVAALSLILALAYPVWAENVTNPGATRKDEIQQTLEQRQQLAQQQREERLAEIKQKIASKAAALRAKLQTFKNQTKATLVERINDTLAKINQRQTDQMEKHLDKMSSILSRLETRVNEATGSGQNTASASAAIANAKTAIASASAAVTSQAGKDYTIKVSSESAVRADAKLARDNLHRDLRDTRSLVIKAKQMVALAIRTVATTLKGIKYGQQ